MGKLRVGLVGLHRGTSYGTQFQNHPKTEVSAGCDIDSNALQEMREGFGLKRSQCFLNYDDFVKEDLDIVFVGSPMPVHAKQTIKALESGKHVLCELTMATNVEDCEKIVETVNRTGMKYMMAENYYYFNYIQEWKKLIQEGKLGRIYYAEAEYVHQIRHLLRDPKTGRLLWRASRPPIHYCAHSLGPVLMLTDDRIVKTTASGKAITMMMDVGLGAIDIQVGLFETQKGSIIKMLRSQVAPREPPIVWYTLYGTKGCVENGRWRHPYTRGVSKGVVFIEDEDKEAREVDWHIADPNLPEEARKGGHGTSEYYLIRDFIDSINNDTKPPIDAVKAADITLPGLIAQEAAMKGNVWLDVPHFE